MKFPKRKPNKIERYLLHRIYLYKIIMIIFAFSMLAFAGLSTYYEYKSNQHQQEASLLCQLANEENGLLQTSLPVYFNQSCQDIQILTFINQSDKDFFCKTIKSIKMPDKLDCSDFK